MKGDNVATVGNIRIDARAVIRAAGRDTIGYAPLRIAHENLGCVVGITTH